MPDECQYINDISKSVPSDHPGRKMCRERPICKCMKSMRRVYLQDTVEKKKKWNPTGWVCRECPALAGQDRYYSDNQPYDINNIIKMNCGGVVPR